MNPYRPLYHELPKRCDHNGHLETCEDRLGCWLQAWDDYFNGLRRYETLPLL